METNRGNSDEPQPGDIIPAAVAGGRLPAHAAAQQDLADGEGSATAQRRTEASRQSRRLIAAANELLALAAELEDVARRGNTGRREDGADREAPALLEDDVRWLRHARRTYRNRRSRNALFADEALFGEPAWDLLLDLFIAAKERKRVPVTSACIGAAVPTTTALRWLAVLEERGLVLREADPCDARRSAISSAPLWAMLMTRSNPPAPKDARSSGPGVNPPRPRTRG